MLTLEQEAAFKKNGYVLGGQVLTSDEVDVLRVEIDRVIADDKKPGVPQPVMLHNMSSTDSPVWQIVNINDASGPFRNLIKSRDIAETIARLIPAETVRLWHDQIQYKPASVGGVNRWHQDAPYWPGLTPMTQVTAWVALDDVDEDNGCMSMVPGSHLWGNHIGFLETLKNIEAMPEEFEGHNLTVMTCPVKKGHVHFHHSLTWHGSTANQSGRPRRAIALHYMSGESVFEKSGKHPMEKFVTSGPTEPISDEEFVKVWPQ
jgi:phytanoyl-CoA hydroxylase